MALQSPRIQCRRHGVTCFWLDCEPGPFTQRDPIGLASGINQYGYAGGDPVNFDDPFGLDVVPKDEESKRIWRRLQRDALTMRMSRDESVRDAGQGMLDMIHDLRQSKQDVHVYTDAIPGARTSETGLLPATMGGGPGINLLSTEFSGGMATLVLAHELGHAHYAWALGHGLSGNKNPLSGLAFAGVRAENLMRVYFGCSSRWTHLTSGPSCPR